MVFNDIWMGSTVPVQRNLHIYLFPAEVAIRYGTLLVDELNGNNCPIGAIATFFDPILGTRQTVRCSEDCSLAKLQRLKVQHFIVDNIRSISTTTYGLANDLEG